MFDQRLIYVGLIISFLGSISYLIDTVKGKAQPNKVSFFIWALAPLIAFSAQIGQGVGVESLLTFIVGFNPLLIFVASFFNRKSSWSITKFDLVCGFLSLTGLVLWLITRVGNLAIFFGILSDGLAAVPTIIKSYKFPETENYWAYLSSAISALLTLMTIDNWSFESSAFSIYILLVCVLLFSLIKFKIGGLLKITTKNS